MLVNTAGQHTTAIAHQIQTLVGTSATVTDIAHTHSLHHRIQPPRSRPGQADPVELAFALAQAAAAGGLVLALGLTAGIGWVLSEVLVTVRTGVFDPPPGALTIPWRYLAAVTVRAASALPRPQPSGKPTSHRSVSCATLDRPR